MKVAPYVRQRPAVGAAFMAVRTPAEPNEVVRREEEAQRNE